MNPYSIIKRTRFDDTKAMIKIKPEDLMREISSSESDVLASISPYGQNPDALVRTKGLKIYRDMLEDDQVQACIQLRKHARLSSPWTIVSAEDGNTEADMYADFIKHVLERLDGAFEDNLYEIYSAIEYGFSLSELILLILPDGPFAGKIGIQAIKTREPYNYDFKVDAFGNLEGLVQIGLKASNVSPTLGGGMTIVPNATTRTAGSFEYGTLQNPYPIDKFIIYSYNSQFGNPYGRSDLLPAFRPFFSKKIVMRFWNIWLERYASPFIWAEVDPSVILKKGSMDEIDDFLKNLSTRAGFRAPKGVKLNSIETSSSAQSAYEMTVEAHNRFISHAILFPNLLGFTGSQGSGGSGGSYALGKTHMDAFIWILNKMGRDTQETIVGDQIIKRLMKLNFPNPDPKLYPKFKFEGVDEDSINTRAMIIKTLSDAGFVSNEEEWVREFLTLPKKEEGIVLSRPIAPGFGGAKGDGQSADNPSSAADSSKEAKANAEHDVPLLVVSHKFQTRNDVMGFEKKLGAKEYKKKLDKLETDFFAVLTKDIEEIRDNMIAFVEKKEIIQSGDPKAVERIFINVGQLKDDLRQWLVKIYLDSKLKALEEISTAGVPVDITKNFAEPPAPLEAWYPLPPSEAVDFFNRKVKAKITNKDGKKVLIELASRSELVYYDQKAFAISGVIRDDILNDAKQVILNGIKRNDQVGALKDLKNVFAKYLLAGIAIEDELLEPHRLNTIVRTNSVEAINEGRRAMYEDPDVKGFVQFWEYSAIMDDRTTDYCRCMDGKVFRIEDLPLLNPPAHFNCRSLSVPITTSEVAELTDNGKGLEISNACPDRAISFKDIKRDPQPLPTLVDPKDPPEIAPTAVKPAVPDLPAAEKSKATQEAQESLRRELMQIIRNCPYSVCRSSKVKMTGSKLNVGLFQCESCDMPFKISSKGDIYLYDAGLDTWERTTVGLMPNFFKERR